jgi:outer membrane protein
MKKRYFKQTALLLLGAFFLNVPSGACAALSIEEAVALALEQNMSVKITQKDEAKAAATLRQAKGNKGFAVTASGEVTTSKTSGEEHTDSSSASLTAKLPLYTGGANEAAVTSGEIGIKSAQLNTERERENIRLSVIKAYYDVLEANKTVDVDQSSVDNYQAHLTNVQQLYSAGSKARIDVLRSSVELSNARQTLIKAQNAYEIDLSTLRNILNLDRNEPLTLTEDFAYSPFDRDMEYCLDYAYTNRKDLIVDQYTLEQKKLAVKSAKAGLLPSLSLSLSTDLSHQFNPSTDNSHGYTAGVSASWDVFDSGVTQAEIDAAKTAAEVADLTLKKDQEDVDLAVRQAYYNMREAEKRFVSTKDAVNQAQEDYYIAREKYRAGEGLILDIIDAQLALSTAQLNYISAQYDYARYKATVENAAGIGADTLETTDAYTKQAAGAPVKPEAPAVPVSQTVAVPQGFSGAAAESGTNANDAAAEAADNEVAE